MSSCITLEAVAVIMELINSSMFQSTISTRLALGGVKWRHTPLLRYWWALQATCMEQAGASRKDPADSARTGSIDFLWGRRAVETASESGAQVRRNPTPPPLPCLLKGNSNQRLWAQKIQTAWLFVCPREGANPGFCILDSAAFWDLVCAQYIFMTC